MGVGPVGVASSAGVVGLVGKAEMAGGDVVAGTLAAGRAREDGGGKEVGAAGGAGVPESLSGAM